MAQGPWYDNSNSGVDEALLLGVLARQGQSVDLQRELVNHIREAKGLPPILLQRGWTPGAQGWLVNTGIFLVTWVITAVVVGVLSTMLIDFVDLSLGIGLLGVNAGWMVGACIAYWFYDDCRSNFFAREAQAEAEWAQAQQLGEGQ